MSSEYVWKETTGKLAIQETRPNYNITFHHEGKQIGALDFNGPEMTFTGDADESAKMFFDMIAQAFKARLEQERAEEREACAKVCETTAPSQINGYECATAIRARSNT